MNISNEFNLERALVGQKIALTCVVAGLPQQILPANGACQWTVPGYAISNYVATVNSGIVYSNFPTANSNVVFYWVDGGIKNVSVAIGQPAATATTTFNVYKPSVAFTDLPPSFATNSIDPTDGTGYLQLGFEAGTGDMQFQCVVDSQYSGAADFRQLINRSAANGNTTSSTLGHYWLDNVLFYIMRNNSSGVIVQANHPKTLTFGDGPSFELGHSLFGNITSVAAQIFFCKFVGHQTEG